MIGLLFSSFLWMALPQGTLPPVLTPDLPTLEAVWKKGYAYAQHNKDLYRPLKLARHGLGTVDGFRVSWVTFLHPRLVAYEAGFAANKQHLSSEQQTASRASLASVVQEETQHLRFHVDLGIYPKGAFSDVSGIYKRADPKMLLGVSVQLQVGDRLYAPVHPPQTIVPEAHKSRHIYTLPNGSADGMGLGASEDYTWYKGQFDVVFDLSNPDGTPRITDTDKEVLVVVNGGFGKQSARFKLDEWQDAYDK